MKQYFYYFNFQFYKNFCFFTFQIISSVIEKRPFATENRLTAFIKIRAAEKMDFNFFLKPFPK